MNLISLFIGLILVCVIGGVLLLMWSWDNHDYDEIIAQSYRDRFGDDNDD